MSMNNNNTSPIPAWQSQSVLLEAQRRSSFNNSRDRRSMFGGLKKSISKRRDRDDLPGKDPVVSRSAGRRNETLGVENLSIQQDTSNTRVRNRSPVEQGFGERSPATRRPSRAGMNAFTVPSNEPPPAYTPSPTVESGPTVPATPSPSAATTSTTAAAPAPVIVPAPAPAPAAAPAPVPAPVIATGTQAEDIYDHLRAFDTVLLIDDSGSMAGRSWRETRQALAQLLPVIVSRDADGIDIHFLNHISSSPGNQADGVAAGGYLNVTTVSQVETIFTTVRPGGGTPTGTRCRAILKPYLDLLQREAAKGKMDDVKPLNMIVITDGVPTDDLESNLVEAATKLDKLGAAPNQVGVQFFQVGNEEEAAEALRELDDDLGDLVEGGVRDMVDTCSWRKSEGADGEESVETVLTGDEILKVVLGAVIRKLDRKKLGATRQASSAGGRSRR